MNKIIIVLALLLIGCKSTTTVSEKDYRVTAEQVAKHLNFLASDERGGRDTGSEGIAESAAYIEDIFSNNGVKPYFETYGDTLTNFDQPAFNVVGWVQGNDPKLKNEFVIVGAHYDHIGQGKPVNGDSLANGANDNASGTSAVIEFAKYFGTHKTNKRSMLFVLFSAEEKGLLGSKHLAEKLKDQGMDLYFMLNFEMIGVPMQREELTYITGYKETNMADVMNGYAGKEAYGFLPKAAEFNLFKRSDNYPFYEQFKVPAQTVCTFDFENYPYYHHVDDEISEMDFNHMATVINTSLPVLKQMTNAEQHEIKFNDPKEY
jgi:hypothetical protein